MTQQVGTSFGTLIDVGLREAWAHEAHQFTPWLAANLDRLADAVGIPLQLTGTEIRVGRFSAYILAKNSSDDSVVLIENQLESSDHMHLGQIMTYLAGLETHTMIWTAPDFREEHLSAVRWLNEHTVEPFAFFAVKLRLVRIGDSPFAPLFEVLERPNNWDRQIAVQRRATEDERSELGQRRFEFWSHLCSRHPELGQPSAAGYRAQALPNADAVVVQYLAKEDVGIFVRPPRGGAVANLAAELEPHLNDLSDKLGAPAGGQTSFLWRKRTFDTRDRQNWDEMADWLFARWSEYRSAFSQLPSRRRET